MRVDLLAVYKDAFDHVMASLDPKGNHWARQERAHNCALDLVRVVADVMSMTDGSVARADEVE